LEEGVATGDKNTDFGMDHIWDKHHIYENRLGGDGSKFPESFNKDDIVRVIFNVIESGEKLPPNPNHPEKYAVQKEVDFGSGVKEVVLVAPDDNGRVLSAYPKKDVKLK